MPRKVLVVDDHAYFRASLAGFLADFPGLEVQTAADGLEAAEVARRFRPDLVIMDVQMPRMSGIAAVELLTRITPPPAIVLYSMHELDIPEKRSTLCVVPKEDVFEAVSGILSRVR